MTRIASLFLMTLWLSGCAASSRPIERDSPTLSSARELIERYNANAEKLDRLWSTTSVFINWRDQQSGKMRREVGDGHFISRRPRDIALTVGKLGQVMFWMGSNAEQFWLFDLLHDDDRVVYVGSHCRATRLFPGMAVRPDEMPGLLAMQPIDPASTDIMKDGDDWLVEIPDRYLRLKLDGRTGLAKRVDLIDDLGYSVVICELVGHKLVRQKGVDRADWPTMPAEAHIHVVGDEGSMVLKLANMTSNPKKIRDRAFDFEALFKMHKPKRTVDLDAQSQAGE